MSRISHCPLSPFDLSQPRFFQPLIPENIRNFKIPKKFVAQYLEDEYVQRKKYVTASLMSSRSDGIWEVKIEDGRNFSEGWDEFVRDHGMEVGDFLVFRYTGNYHFYVQCYDTSACEREYPLSEDQAAHQPLAAVNEGSRVEASEERNVARSMPSTSVNHNGKGGECNRKDGSLRKNGIKRKARTNAPCQAVYPHSGNPYFHKTISQTNWTMPSLTIPNGFARAHGLANRWCDLTIIDEDERPYTVTLRYKRSGKYQVYISSQNLCRFLNENSLKRGDPVIFELIDSGQEPVMKIHRA